MTRVAKPAKIISGQGAGHFATMGAKIVMKRPRTLQQPYAVASRMVGKNYGLIRYATSNAHTTPKFVINTNKVVNSPESGPAVINIIEKDPTAINPTKNVNAFLSVAKLVIKTHKIHPTNSATSELRRLAYTSPV